MYRDDDYEEYEDSRKFASMNSCMPLNCKAMPFQMQMPLMQQMPNKMSFHCPMMCPQCASNFRDNDFDSDDDFENFEEDRKKYYNPSKHFFHHHPYHHHPYYHHPYYPTPYPMPYPKPWWMKRDFED